ncbi:MAG: pyrimidine-nucleoside phosphorylase, partial [Lachnospiraceae bacterium]
MRAVDIIEDKKCGRKLTREQIEFMVKGFTDGDIPDYQMSAFLMAVYFAKMDEYETAWLTQAMADSGDKIDLSPIKGIKVDKHSTGG